MESRKLITKKKKKRKISERGNKNSEEQKLSYYLNQKVFG